MALGKCLNTPGSFICTCPDGYKLSSNGAMCLDVNECLENNNDFCMDGFCINTDGGVECECPRDWVLAEDGKRCLDTRTETCYDRMRYPEYYEARYDYLTVFKTQINSYFIFILTIEVVFARPSVYNSPPVEPVAVR